MRAGLGWGVWIAACGVAAATLVLLVAQAVQWRRGASAAHVLRPDRHVPPYLREQPLEQLQGVVYGLPQPLGNDRRPFVGLWPAAASTATGSSGSPPQQRQQQWSATSAGPPAEFDAWAYVDYNPQLVHSLGAGRSPHVSLHEAAWQQYKALLQLQAGGSSSERAAATAGVYCRRIPVVLSYGTGEMGLTNQIFTHISAWALAVQLGADVLIPPGVRRGSFGQEGGYVAAPFEGMFSWPETQQLLQGLGVQACLYPSLNTSTQRLMADTADYLQRELDAPAPPQQQQQQAQKQEGAGGMAPAPAGQQPALRQALLLTGLRHALLPIKLYQPLPLEVLRGMSVTAVMRAAASSAAASSAAGLDATAGGAGGLDAAAADAGGAALPCAAVPLVHLHLDKPMMAMRVAGVPLAAHLAARISFSPVVEHRVAELLQAMAARNVTRFNAVHLRVEGDQPYTRRYGGVDATLHMYVKAARSIGLGAGAASDDAGRLPIYVASGLLSYPQGAELWRRAKKALEPLGSALLTKEDLLPPDPDSDSDSAVRGAEAGGAGGRRLHSEQQAAVDFVMLERAVRFVGMAESSMSFFIAERRKLAGLPRNASALVGTPFEFFPDTAVFTALAPPPAPLAHGRWARRRRRG